MLRFDGSDLIGEQNPEFDFTATGIREAVKKLLEEDYLVSFSTPKIMPDVYKLLISEGR